MPSLDSYLPDRKVYLHFPVFSNCSAGEAVQCLAPVLPRHCEQGETQTYRGNTTHLVWYIRWRQSRNNVSLTIQWLWPGLLICIMTWSQIDNNLLQGSPSLSQKELVKESPVYKNQVAQKNDSVTQQTGQWKIIIFKWYYLGIYPSLTWANVSNMLNYVPT